MTRFADAGTLGNDIPQQAIEQVAIAGRFIERDVILLKKCLPRQLALLRQRVILSACCNIHILHQREKFDFRRQVSCEANTKIRLASGHGVHHVARATVDELNANARIARLKTTDHIGHKVTGRGRDRGNRDQPRPLFADLIDIRQH